MKVPRTPSITAAGNCPRPDHFVIDRVGWIMSTTSVPEVVHDGSVERTVDPEEVSLVLRTELAALSLPHAPLNPCRVPSACVPTSMRPGCYAAGCAGQLGKREGGADLARRRLGEGTRST